MEFLKQDKKDLEKIVKLGDIIVDYIDLYCNGLSDGTRERLDNELAENIYKLAFELHYLTIDAEGVQEDYIQQAEKFL